ncbi:MAG: S1 RNA-binding domain-containing protein, partial [Candidatus Micrarchaeota archaeon]
MMETPEKDELVIATIRKIFPYGAFCSLDEYDNKEAFVHISEVASRWVKNIHEFLKENQK